MARAGVVSWRMDHNLGTALLDLIGWHLRTLLPQKCAHVFTCTLKKRSVQFYSIVEVVDVKLRFRYMVVRA